MALAQVNTGAAVAGGVGEGLKSFASAYMDALRYQLQKQQQAQTAKYQDEMSQVAGRNATSGAISAASEGYKAGGSPLMDPNLKLLGLNAPKYPSPEPDTSTAANTQQAPLAPSSIEQYAGFIGPPQQPGLLPKQEPAPSGAQPAGLMGAPSAGGKGAYIGGGWPPPGMIPSEAQNAAAMDLRNKALAANEKEGMTGQHFTPNYKTMDLDRSEAPLNQFGQLELGTKKQTLQNETANQRSANSVPVTQFNENKAVIAARESAVPMAQVVQLLSGKNISQENKQAALMTALRVIDPSVPNSAKKPDDVLQNAEGISPRVISILKEAAGKGIDDKLLYGTVSAAANIHIANTQGAQSAAAYAQKQEHAFNLQHSPLTELDPAVIKAANGARQLLKKSSSLPAPAPEESGFKGILNAGKGLINSLKGNPETSHPLGGKTIMHNGIMYNVAPNGDLTPVKK